MSFTPGGWLASRDHVGGARSVPSLDALLDPLQLLAVTATRIRRVDLGHVGDRGDPPPSHVARAVVRDPRPHRDGAGDPRDRQRHPREHRAVRACPYADNVARLEEALTIIRLLWESGGRPVDYDGRFWRLRDAVFRLAALPRTSAAALRGGALPAHAAARRDGSATAGCRARRVTAESTAGALAIIEDGACRRGRTRRDVRSDADACSSPSAQSREQVHRAGDAEPGRARAMALGARRPAWAALGLTHPLGAEHGGLPRSRADAHQRRRRSTARSRRCVPELLAGTALSRQRRRDRRRGGAARRRPGAATSSSSRTPARASWAARGDGARGLVRLGQLMRQLRRL